MPSSRDQDEDLKEYGRRCWLDPMSGYLSLDDAYANRPGARKLWIHIPGTRKKTAGKNAPSINVYDFTTCPKCRHQLGHARITPISTRGNQPFYNVIHEQFEQQPPVQKRLSEPEKYPNQGRKVLLFSDSRQRAATLARDFTDISTEIAVRKLFVRALREMRNAEESNQNLERVYGYVLWEALKENLVLFTGNSRFDFRKHLNEMQADIDGQIMVGQEPRPYFADYGMDKAPEEMKEQLIRLFCGRYNTLNDAAMCHLVPTQRDIARDITTLRSKGISVSQSEYIEVFSAVIRQFIDENAALGHQIPDRCRRQVRKDFGEFGLRPESELAKLPTIVGGVLGIGENREAQARWMEIFRRYCERGSGDTTGRQYLDLEKLRPVFDPDHVWKKCAQCASVSPFALRGRCQVCGRETLTDLLDFSAERYWRQDLIRSLSGDKIRVMDTEEHTAQLSHKDQRDTAWSVTEQYEMRFQDIVRVDRRSEGSLESMEDDALPVDILSSTTTMEVGIDIGSLVSVGLRNVPPMRENYQQRAGRAGRRSASLSTIVTFAESGPHDSYYFGNPSPMYCGNPRKPWIDATNEKLLSRHLNMIALTRYLTETNASLDTKTSVSFLDGELDAFENWLGSFQPSREILEMLLSRQGIGQFPAFKPLLIESLKRLKAKRDLHPELFGTDGEVSKQLSMLDALYDEGIIPTYSFPKDVVGLYIENHNHVVYQPERGLSIAISEYAPGRAVTVDKQTYQIGGIYARPFTRTARVEDFFKDEHYYKELSKCRCGWVGVSTTYAKCPCCGNEDLDRTQKMLRPWGFSPKNGTAIERAQLDEVFSFSEEPSYSDVPVQDEMRQVQGFQYLRMKVRPDQTLILLNEGEQDASAGPNGEGKGFMVCRTCGAAVPGNDPEKLKEITCPGKKQGERYASHRHDPVPVSLGFDFRTDLLVFEVTLPCSCIDVKTPDASDWLYRARTTLADAICLTAGRILDIEYGEIEANSRMRTDEDGGTRIEIFLFDSLSSGAGYSTRIAGNVERLMTETRTLLTGCHCDSACNDCLKHYRNRFHQDHLDRYAALDLLNWAQYGELPKHTIDPIALKCLEHLVSILKDAGIDLQREMDGTVYAQKGHLRKMIDVYPAMEAGAHRGNRDVLYVSRNALRFAKPDAFECILREMPGRG